MDISALQCPLCQLGFEHTGKTLRCAKGHCFDVAKEGYVNLLPAHFKHSKQPGDDKNMLNARRRFLSSGMYQPVKDKIGEIVHAHLPLGYALDLGCGEGFYSSALDAIDCVYGLDIAKDGVRLASKTNKQASFVVASSMDTPFKSDQFDFILSCFAPFSTDEIKRILAKDGLFLQITPAPRHLFQLKSLVYDQVNLHPDISNEIEGLALCNRETLQFEMHFEQADSLLDLIDMTPFTWQLVEKKRAAIGSATPLRVEAAFNLSLWKKID